MTALLDATHTQMATLAGLVASLEAAESTLSSMTAARDGLLAIAGRLAIDIAKQGDHPDKGDHSIRTIAAEIAAVQHVSDRTVERRMMSAGMLVEEFPAVWEAQGAGRISAAHSRVIVDAGSRIGSSESREAYAAAVLPLAEAESPNRLRPLARRIAERFAPSTIDERHRRARSQRRVWVSDGEDGMAGLQVHAPAALVHGMFDRLSQAAQIIREENRRAKKAAARAGQDLEADDRTVDEIRADLLVDLVLTGTWSGHDSEDGLLSEIRGRIEVTVPVTTLMQGDEGDASAPTPPAELDGALPIDGCTARFLASAASVWDRVLTHPVSGRMLGVDGYRPSRRLRRHLRARDQRCRFPGCGIAARKCDLDHNHAASAGGATCETNLAAFCRRHHLLKHHSPWHVRQRPGGVLEWTSPTGRSYIDRPPPQHTVTFSSAADEPPPF
ncbi:HNH endonuclease signature motif containing protein [Microbacterium sp. 3J1]|uniref:HNH endonuclease signature motif containing protein n=1 Tax=Microbacterium sp. 3J1 TaxID=861269 RepID=UPI000ACCC471|nr:HNH endonuclease signature motif containing protein [Microbacterium sp. 3J1]